MKFRVFFDSSDEITVITEDGGIACIREAESLSDDEPRIAVTDYYQMKLTDSEIDADNIFERLGEGHMYCHDWADTPFNSLTAIQDALDWLVVGETNWEISDSLFPEFFDNNKASETVDNSDKQSSLFVVNPNGNFFVVMDHVSQSKLQELGCHIFTSLQSMYTYVTEHFSLTLDEINGTEMTIKQSHGQWMLGDPRDAWGECENVGDKGLTIEDYIFAFEL